VEEDSKILRNPPANVRCPKTLTPREIHFKGGHLIAGVRFVRRVMFSANCNRSTDWEEEKEIKNKKRCLPLQDLTLLREVSVSKPLQEKMAGQIEVRALHHIQDDCEPSKAHRRDRRHTTTYSCLGLIYDESTPLAT